MTDSVPEEPGMFAESLTSDDPSSVPMLIPVI